MLTGVLSKIEVSNILASLKNEDEEVNKYLLQKGVNTSIVTKVSTEAKNEFLYNGIINRYMLHKLGDKNALDLNYRIDPQIIEKIEIASDFSIDIILKSTVLEFLYTFVFHPDHNKDNTLNTGFKTIEDKYLFIINFKKAIKLIKLIDSNHFKMIKQSLLAVSPIYLNSPLIKGDVISFGSDYSIGLIVYSPCPEILTAETIIHETRHNVLFKLMRIYNFTKNPKLLVKTPLREDERPLSMLLHQAYVLSGLARFYRLLLAEEEYANMANVQKRALLQFSDYKYAIEILSANKEHFTSHGLLLLNQMITDEKQY